MKDNITVRCSYMAVAAYVAYITALEALKIQRSLTVEVTRSWRTVSLLVFRTLRIG